MNGYRIVRQRQPTQNSKTCKRGQRQTELLFKIHRQPQYELWCTGKDSNLRTSEEGQIYSLLALTTHPPVRKQLLAVSSWLLAKTSLTKSQQPIANSCISDTPQPRPAGPSTSLGISARGSDAAQTPQPCHWDQKVREEKPALTTHLEKFPYGVPMEKLSAARPANPAVSRNASSRSGLNHWSWRRDLNP